MKSERIMYSAVFDAQHQKKLQALEDMYPKLSRSDILRMAVMALPIPAKVSRVRSVRRAVLVEEGDEGE